MRPGPVEQAITVRSGIEHTFDVFVRRLDRWWPTHTHSLGLDRVERVVFEEEVGGRIYEVQQDGTEATWGTVLAFERPARFRMTWDIQRGTEVEVRFRSLGPALTRVELEHAGWDRLSMDDLAAATKRGSYDEGWSKILTLFLTAAEGQP
jgi:activator of Hsp90 ATPase-like protein